jgi:hypothetical protein
VFLQPDECISINEQKHIFIKPRFLLGGGECYQQGKCMILFTLIWACFHNAKALFYSILYSLSYKKRVAACLLKELYHTGRTTEYTEWQWPFSAVHSIMEKLAQSGECGDARPFPFTIYHHVQSCSIRSSWEGRYTPPISSLPLYVYSVRLTTHERSPYV